MKKVRQRRNGGRIRQPRTRRTKQRKRRNRRKSTSTRGEAAFEGGNIRNAFRTILEGRRMGTIAVGALTGRRRQGGTKAAFMVPSTDVTMDRIFTKIGSVTKFLAAEALENTVLSFQVLNSDTKVEKPSKNRESRFDVRRMGLHPEGQENLGTSAVWRNMSPPHLTDVGNRNAEIRECLFNGSKGTVCPT